MKLENQVCTLAQAKQIRGLGVSQVKSLFSWVFNANHKADKAESYWLLPQIGTGFHRSERNANPYINRETDTATFTAAELGEMLPRECYTMLEPGVEMHIWHCGTDNEEVLFPANTEAQAKAELLIWLLEQGHTTAEEVNERLAAA